MCRRGKSYSPRIVRVGLSVHHSVESVALDTLVQKHLQADKVRQPPLSAGGADIICSTLSYADSSLFVRMSCPFNVVVTSTAA